MKKKILIISGILIVIVVILLIIGIIWYFNDKAKYDFEVEQVTEINYLVLQEDDKYGVIDKYGNIVVEPVYDIIQIPNPSKAIFVCMYDYDTDEREYQIDVLNEAGEKLYSEYDSVQAIATETTYDGIPFEKSVLQYKKDGKYGLINMEGEELTDAIYDSISAIAYKEGMLLVEKDDKYGVVNMNGVTVISVEYESITSDNYYSSETFYKTTGFIVCKKTDDGYRYGYINYQGHEILDTNYTQISRITEIEAEDVYLIAYKDGQAGVLQNKKVILNYEYEDISYNSYNDMFIIQRNGKQGVIDMSGNVKIAAEYDNISFGGIYVNAEIDGETVILDLDGNQVENQDIVTKMLTMDGEHYIIADVNEMYDITDLSGQSIIENSYSYMEEITENYFVVGNNNKNGIIDLSGKAVVDLKYNSIFAIDGTNLLQANISSSKTISLINKDTMEILVTLSDASVEIEENYTRVYNDTESYYFDDSGNEITVQEAMPENSLYAIEEDGLWGFVDQNGNIIIECIYEAVTEFNEYGFAGIMLDDMWGSIDSNGEVVQEPIYELDWTNPMFIGKYYQLEEWYSYAYYTSQT